MARKKRRANPKVKIRRVWPRHPGTQVVEPLPRYDRARGKREVKRLKDQLDEGFEE